jgi:hypothetical protein
LEPGKTYAYKVKIVRTNANGKKVEQTRTVQVHAGDYVNLDLRQELPSEKTEKNHESHESHE